MVDTRDTLAPYDIIYHVGHRFVVNGRAEGKVSHLPTNQQCLNVGMDIVT